MPSRSLLESVDEWYGVRYRVGGNTKTGIDCSGLTVAVYAAVYGMMIPRVSREQYRISRKISTTELPYYLKRFVGAGRMDDKQAVASN